jgi:hypothetical protein
LGAQKEDAMRTLTHWAMATAALFVVAGGNAKAAEVDVRIPFSFVVQGHQFPAGQYRVEENQSDHSIVLIRSEYGKTAGMFVLTTPVADPDPAGDKPALTFSRYENQYRLDDIWDASGQGREINASRAQKQTAPKHAAPAPTHSTQGVVKSMDADKFVITRNDTAHSEMTFMMNPSTHKEGTMAVGSSVSVRYRQEGNDYVATAVSVKQTKQQASAHAAPKKK